MSLLQALLNEAVRTGASDIHLTSDQAPRMRVDGSMKRLNQQVISTDVMLSMIQSIAPEERWIEFQNLNDTDFAYNDEDLGRFRVNAFQDISGPGMVLRAIPNKILSPEELGLPTPVLDFCNLNKGLVLVTGPTGSGKSTTLASLIDQINQKRNDHIITIEDPIEFIHTNKRCLINQREVGTHTRSFKSALRAALREDPDVLLIGELRDLETVQIALEMAETGHLVFGTLHTTTAHQTIDRLIDQFPANQQAQIRVLLAGTLRGVLSQTLMRRYDGPGRVAAMELLVVNYAVAAIIRDGKTHQIPSIMQTQRKLGMLELNDSLLSLVQMGRVTAEEAWRKAVDKQALTELYRRSGIHFDTQKMSASFKADQPKGAAHDRPPWATNQRNTPPRSTAKKPPPKKGWFG